MGLLEDHVHQLAGVDLGQSLAHMGGGVFSQRANGGNLGRRPLGGFFHGQQLEDDPQLQVAGAGGVQQQSVVVGFVGNDVAAEGNLWLRAAEWMLMSIVWFGISSAACLNWPARSAL